MRIEFLHPLWLVLFPILLGVICYIAWKGKFPSRFQRGLHTGVRIAVCLLLVLAMATPLVSFKSQGTTTIFAVDRSSSAKSVDVSGFLQEAYSTKSDKDSVGLVYFGANGSVEHMPTTEALSFTNDGGYVDESNTDIASALQLATGIMPEGRAKKIVLVSDGQETKSDALSVAKSLAGMDVVVDVFEIQAESVPEIQLTKMEVPAIVNKNMEYNIALQIDSNMTTEAEIRLYKDNVLIGQEAVTVSSGESKMIFTDTTSEGGSAVYQAEIFATEDSSTKNNRVYGHTFIDDVPRILILEQEESGAEWARLLSATAVQTTRMDASAVPTALEQIQGYDGIVLANVSIDTLPDGFLEILETYSRTLGGGLVVSGGKNAFALGGYTGTILEEMLPVSMELKTEGQEHDLALLMVIDRSGSMASGEYNISMMEIAKEAAIRGLDSLKAQDKVGVIAFDSKPNWAVPITPVTDKDEIIAGIANIQNGGGTSILPALQEAITALIETDAKEKHIILLTDGQAEQSGYESWIEKMKMDGITLSTVAVGSGADVKLMERLANTGNGRYYFTNEFTDLPEIFLKETLLAGKEYLNNRNFYPKQQDASAILSGISATPPLDGYVGTSAKGRAQVALVSDKDEPILASWQYGLGRVVTWTSDVGEGWTQDWLAQSEGAGVLQNSVSWVLNMQTAQDMLFTAQSGTENSTLHLEMPYDETISSIQAVSASSTGETFESELNMIAPGVYEGTMATTEEGAYIANLEMIKTDGTTSRYRKGFSISYPMEYDITFRKEGLLPQIAASTGGRVLSSGADVFGEELQAVKWSKDVSILLLALAVILFVLDIALRRFSVLAIGLENRAAAFGRKRAERKNARKQSGKSMKQKVQDKGNIEAVEKTGDSEVQQSAEKKTKNADAKETQTPVPKTMTTAEKLAEARKKREGK